jgi:3-dehydroquinate synthase
MSRFLKGFRAALIDMDGVLYDSMKLHTLAWQQMMQGLGVECTRDEFYLYEGMTGHATINLLFKRAFGKEVDAERARELYKIKSDNFHKIGPAKLMPGADRMLKALERAGLRRVLVTGSGQASLLEGINADYPGAFAPGDRVTGHDVKHGKPDPEPYLKGMEIAGIKASEAVVIENAPLGVRAGKASGAFTIAVTTGPIPREEFEKEGADLIFGSMPEFADWLEKMEDESSQIYEANDLDRDLTGIIRGMNPDKVVIITDSNVAPLIGGVMQQLSRQICERIDFPAGEGSKNLDELAKIWKRMIDFSLTRRSVVVNIGGGVVTDMGGFAAATFKRGVRFINVPTTLLGMADAAVGGKTGIDFEGLKNEIGAFASADVVVVSHQWLSTLPRTELLSGFAEVLKTAIISEDFDLYNRLSADGAIEDLQLLGSAGATAARFKEKVVRRDPKEKGMRKILNFGHTWGHAYESLALRRGIPITHGEAVAHGMLRALEMSRDCNGYSADAVEGYRKLLNKLYNPLPYTDADLPELEALMKHDKKNYGSATPAFILLPLPPEYRI